MRYLASEPDCYLVELKDLAEGSLPPHVEPSRAALAEVVGWTEEFLCRPHPELGRAGPVCPYVQAAMSKGLFFLTVCRGGDLDGEAVLATIMRYRDWFLEIEPRTGPDAMFKTILVLFPDIELADAPRLIDGTQEALKPRYVAKGLMVGEFHPLPPDKAGLWNPDFRPLRCPVPLLAIRHLVATDFPFLRGDRELLASYLRIHGDAVPVHIKEQVREAAQAFGLELAEPALHPRVRAALKRAGVAFRTHRHAGQALPITGPADFARALGYPLARITKSLFLRCPCHGKYVVVVCSVNKKLNLRRLAWVLGCKRLELASPEELAIVLGYPSQGVAPLAAAGTQVLMDEDLLAHPTVLTAAGEVEVEVEIAPADLRKASNALLFASSPAMESRGELEPAATGS